jgi:3-methyladenine DNA glycosylase AlkD
VKDILDITVQVESLMEKQAHAPTAEQMAAYMKNQFDFYGIKRPLLLSIYKPFLNELQSYSWEDKKRCIDWCWEKPQREWQYLALDILIRNRNQLTLKDIDWLEWLIRTQPWWDTVDTIGSYGVGTWASLYPKAVGKFLKKWTESDHMWLQRCTIIYQLKYKENTDVQVLFTQCDCFKSSKEFFLRKAIGWALRAYADVNAKAVVNYVKKARLQPLSEKEALRKVISK